MAAPGTPLHLLRELAKQFNRLNVEMVFITVQGDIV